MKHTIRPRTPIENWLYRNRLSYRAAGEIFGCSGEYVRQIATGKKPATGDTAQKIVAAVKSNNLPTSGAPA